MLIQLEHWSEAIEYLESAIGKQCKKQKEEALFLLGMAAYHEGKFAQAHQAFHQARKCPKLSRQADNWLEMVNNKNQFGF